MAALSAVIAATGAITVGLVAAPMAASASSLCAAGPSVTSTFTSNQLATYTVPAGVTRVVATVAGGAGGVSTSGAFQNFAGNGAIVTSTLAVSPGDSLSVSVGQAGSLGTGGLTGGNASGGSTGNIGGAQKGGGGGGASFVTNAGTLLIAAGGGGGTGQGSGPGSNGGNAASAVGPQSAGTIVNGANGQNANPAVQPQSGGGGGGTATPGAAGFTTSGFTSITSSQPGSGEVGGGGSIPYGNAGGGGGGYAGGGGGGMGGWSSGGGAGSSYGIDAYNLAANSGDGSVTISYSVPSVLSANSVTFPAQLHGSFTVCAPAVPEPTITESGALPTGVTLLDNGDGTATLAGTPASGTEGSYPLTFTATNGDGSAAVQTFMLTVSTTTPTVSLSASPASSTFGNPVTFTATVSGVPLGTSPTGTVDFQNSGASISTGCDAAPVSTTAGVSTATCTTSGLSVGTNPMTATYSGNTDYTSGVTATDNEVVARATPGVSLSTSSNPSVYGQAVTATATITPSGLAGTVQFKVNGTNVGSPVVVSSGSAQSVPLTVAANPLPVGSPTVSATFTPTDTTDYLNGAAGVTQVVNRPATVVFLATSPNPSVHGQSVTATATITPSNAAGSVQFTVNGTNLGSPVVVSSGSAQSVPLTIGGNPLPAGTTTVGATFTPTDTSDYNSGSGGTNQIVGVATPVVSLSSSPTSSTFGDSVTFTAEVDGALNGSTPTGTVAFQAHGSSIKTACDAAAVSTTAGVSTATCTTAALIGGTYSVTASYSGNTNYNGGTTATDTFTVNRATPGVTLSTSSNPSVYGQAVTATATITPSDLAGTVQFKVNGTAVGSPVTVSSGTAQSPSLTEAGDPLPTGDTVISATFVPTDTTDYLNSGAGIEQSVDKATPAVSVTASTMSSNFGDPVTFTAEVDGVPTGTAPTGTVAFQHNGNSLNAGCDAATVSTTAGVSTATCTTTALTTGANTITATYNGDSSYLGGVSAVVDHSVVKATPGVDLTSSSNPSVFGQAVTVTAAITPSDLAGTVQFAVNGTPLGSPVTVTAGSAQSPTITDDGDALDAGEVAVSAIFTPTDTTDYLNGVASMQQTVDKAAPAVSLTADVNPSVYGQPTTTTAAITPSNLSGSVQFSVNGTDVGSPVTVTSGTATSSPLTDAGDPLAVGDNTVAATFTPTDTTDYTTAANSLDQVVDQAATTTAIGVTSSTLTADLTAVAPGAGTPTGTVTFSVDGTSVGTATLSNGAAAVNDALPTGETHNVSAIYSGDTDFTGSSNSTSRLDPTITATVTSAHPKTTAGWYRSPVTVTFTCTTNGAPLTGACPTAATMGTSGGGQSVTRTITATDGGTATVAVTSINIDRVKPEVRIGGVRNHGAYNGVAPNPRCVGTDKLSGLDTCALSIATSGPSATDVTTVHYTAVATDKAGNSATARDSVRVRGFFVKAATLVGGAYNVRIGHHYVVGFVSKTRPRYVDATPARGPRPTPFNNGLLMANAGHGVWTMRISITAAMHHHALWNIGVRANGKLHVLTIRLR